MTKVGDLHLSRNAATLVFARHPLFLGVSRGQVKGRSTVHLQVVDGLLGSLLLLVGGLAS